MVEALVVVVLITILLTLLLPALGSARRRTKVSACASNLRQFAVGLTMYATSNDREYPPNLNSPLTNWTDSRHIWKPAYYPGAGYVMENYLDMFLEVVAGGNGKIMFCPLDKSFRPENYQVNPIAKYDGHFAYRDPDVYLAGYLRFAGHRSGYDWSNSGNTQTDHAPFRMGDPLDHILSDIIWSDVDYSDVHSNDQHADTDLGEPAEHIDNNVAFGDTRVETHYHELTEMNPWPHWTDHYVIRGPACPTCQYQLY